MKFSTFMVGFLAGTAAVAGGKYLYGKKIKPYIILPMTAEERELLYKMRTSLNGVRHGVNRLFEVMDYHGFITFTDKDTYHSLDDI